MIYFTDDDDIEIFKEKCDKLLAVFAASLPTCPSLLKNSTRSSSATTTATTLRAAS